LVEREYERESRDSDGKRETQREFETVSSNESFAPCSLEDASGSVAIDFAGAKVEALQVHQSYEPAGAGSLVGSLLGVGGTTLGQRYTEWIIPAGVPVYVLGSVLASGAVGASPSKADPFVISHKSKEERTRSLGWTRLWLVVGAVACFALAVALVVWSVQSPG